MATELTPIDVTDSPELLRLAEEVRRSGRSCVLRRADEDLAVLSPLARPATRGSKRVKTDADRAAFLSSAGGWKDNVDGDTFLEDN